MYFVKIGAPADFAYAVDQAILTLEKIKNNNGIIGLPSGESVELLEFKLVFLFSINFLIHIIELKQRLNTQILN